jgi:hypothetical protein
LYEITRHEHEKRLKDSIMDQTALLPTDYFLPAKAEFALPTDV